MTSNDLERRTDRRPALSLRHRRSQGVHRAEKKNWGPNLQGKVVSASPPDRECTPPPEAEQESIFRKLGDLDLGRTYLNRSLSVCFEGDD